MHNDDSYYLLSLPLSWEDSNKFTKDSSYSDDVLLEIKAKQKKKMMILKVKKRRRLKKCSICNKSFVKNKFKFHLLSHSNKMIYHCKYCKIKFAQHETYVQHLSLHVSELTDTNPHVYSKTNYYYRCNLCDKQFRKKSEYRSHLIVHNNESRLNKERIKGCTNLLKGEDKESNITRMNIHTSDTIENDCRDLVYFKNRNSSENNLFTKKSSKSFSCNFCKKSFKNLYHMLQHVRIHTGEKPYKCHICGLAFLQSGHFHKHMRSHGHSKPFQCENCGKRFSLYTKFQLHSSTQCLDGTVPDIESKTQNARYAKDTSKIIDERYKCLVVIHKMEINDFHKNLHFVDDYDDDYINNNSINNSCDMKKIDMNYRMDNGDDVIDRSHEISSRYHKVIGSGLENDDGQLNVNHDVKCKLCSKTFLHKRNIYRHMRVVHGISDALSTLRERNFDKKVNNVSDKDRIVKNCSYPLNVNQQYMCDICDKTFAYRNNVIKHKRVVHKIFDVYSCKQCSVSFFTYKEWNLHRKSFHTSVANCYDKQNFNKQMKSYECRLCNHKFNFLGNYKKHIKTYRHKQRLKEYIVQQKEKNSSLTIEGMNRKRYPLRKSINSGNENKLEGMNRKKCPFRKKINPHNSLNLELLSNVDGKLTCNICHKQYLNEHTLKKHSLLHRKLKKIYSCIPCEHKFNDFGNYKKHLETLVHQRNLKEYIVQQKEKKSYYICLNDSLQSVSKRDVKVDNVNRKRSHSSTSMKFDLQSNDDEKVTVYSCELCDHKSNLLGNYKKHLQTIKHQRRYREYIAKQKKRKLSFIPSRESPKNVSQKGVNRKDVNSAKLSKSALKSIVDEKVMKYSCKPCGHKFNHLGNYKQHLKTLIHQRRRREYVAQQKKRKFSSTSSKDSLKKVGLKGANKKSVNPVKLSTLELQSNGNEKVTVYSCELCDHKSNLLGNYKKHLQTIKHQKRYREYIAQQKNKKISFISSKDSSKSISQKGVNRKGVNSAKLSKSALKSIVDEKVMKYSCKPCDHKFNHLGNYKQHLKTLIHQRRRREYVAQQKKRKYSFIPLRDSLKIDSKEEGRRFLKNAINKQILKCEAGVKDCSITVNNFTNL